MWHKEETDPEVYLESCQTSMTEFFWKNSQQLSLKISP